MEECVRAMQDNLRSAAGTMRRAKSVYTQNSLGTIKQRKREKKKQSKNNNSDIIMRILRMRYVLDCNYLAGYVKSPFTDLARVISYVNRSLSKLKCRVNLSVALNQGYAHRWQMGKGNLGVRRAHPPFHLSRLYRDKPTN